MATCRSCGALIAFVKLMPGGRLHPVDAAPATDGNIEVSENGSAHVLTKVELERCLDPEAELYRSHFATCPEADAWRKK